MNTETLNIRQRRRSSTTKFVVAVVPGVCLALLSLSIGGETPTSSMLGFSVTHAADERSLEQRFDDSLNAADQREWMQRMASEPNQVGSAHDKGNAQFMLQQFRAWGWDAEIETFSVLYPTPKRIALQMIAPTQFTAKPHEPALKGDRTSGNTAAGLPPYNVYGADGDVTGDLVYVNYGMQFPARPQLAPRRVCITASRHRYPLPFPASYSDSRTSGSRSPPSYKPLPSA